METEIEDLSLIFTRYVPTLSDETWKRNKEVVFTCVNLETQGCTTCVA